MKSLEADIQVAVEALPFSMLQIITNYGDILLSLLRPRVEAWGPQQCLGDVFMQIVSLSSFSSFSSFFFILFFFGFFCFS